MNFLEQSHDLNPQFNLGTRIYLLQRQAEAMSRVDGELGQEWAQELLALSKQTKSELRSFAENSAMSILVRLNPDRALLLLHSLSKQEPPESPSQSLPDMLFVQRAFEVLVEENGVDTLPQLEQEAARLGADGQYPYSALGHAAMQSVSKEWATNRRHAVEVVQRVFDRAFERYSEGSRGYFDDYEFGRMLQEVGGVPHEFLKPALRLLVKNLLATDTSKYAFQAEVYANDGKIAKADNAIDAALLNFGTLINRIDSELAQQLESSRPELQTALEYAKDGRLRLLSFGPKWWTQTTRPSDPNADGHMDALRLTNINPDAAVAKAEQLPDVNRRADTMLQMAGNMAANQPERAQELIVEAEGAAKTDTSELQLETISGKASVAAAQGKKDDVRELLRQGFNLATSIVMELRKKGDVSFLKGLPPLIQIGMNNDPDSTVAFVESVPASWMKANLLLGVAGALDRQGRHPVGPLQPQRSEKSNP